MKILELTAFSSGICGLWARVEKESELLSKKGHEVFVFSSNIKRGSGKIEFAPEKETKKSFQIKRFKTFGNFGENTFFWDCTKETLKLKPEIIITHAYRQYYSTNALKIARKLKIPCILVTHAPFLEKKLRNHKLNFAVWFYDNFIGRRILNKYSKIFAITKWEIPYLLKLGAKKEKIVYVPNGIPEEFFKINIPKPKNKKKLLFLGRIAPIKNLEILIKAIKICNNKNISLNLVGPTEKEYGKKLRKLISDLGLKDQIKIHPPVYDLKEKIRIIDDSDVFILPSKREAMPQSLIEAMSREKIVISSKTEGGEEILKNGENGYLFEIGGAKQLAEKILESLKDNKTNIKIKRQARKSVEKFSWNKLIDEINVSLKIINNKNLVSTQ